MRSDRRKRLEELARRRRKAPIAVTRDFDGSWLAECDASCENLLSLSATLWQDAYEAAVGHACVSHRGGSA